MVRVTDVASSPYQQVNIDNNWLIIGLRALPRPTRCLNRSINDTSLLPPQPARQGLQITSLRRRNSALASRGWGKTFWRNSKKIGRDMRQTSQCYKLNLDFLWFRAQWFGSGLTIGCKCRNRTLENTRRCFAFVVAY